MDALLRRLLRAAFRRGLAGDWTWMLIGITAYILRRALKDKDDLVTSFRISPGDQFLITLRDPFAPAAEASGANDTGAGSAGNGGAGNGGAGNGGAGNGGAGNGGAGNGGAGAAIDDES